MENKSKMSQQQVGFAFHVHHDILCEFVYPSYDERVDYIKKNKLEEEIAIRLRLFQMIPDSEMPPKLLEAADAYSKACKACDKAKDASNEAWDAYEKEIIILHKKLCPYYPWDGHTIFPELWNAYVEARKVYDEVNKVLDEVVKSYVEAWKDCEKEIIILHKKLCPDCPWDGHTIFPE